MGSPGLTIFLVFFGISLLDALRGGHWLRAVLWIAMGLAFYALDRVRRGRTGGAKPAAPPSV
jgi:hypothetical protein